MKSYFGRFVSHVLVGICLALVVTTFFARTFTPDLTWNLDLSEIVKEQGYAFTTPVPDLARFPYRLEGGALGSSRSNLVLFEAGRQLGPANSPHAVIRTEGRGAYSHWGQSLYFSSSDGSDPRTNGREYSAHMVPIINPLFKHIVLIVSALSASALFLSGSWRVYITSIMAILPFAQRHRRVFYGSAFALSAAALSSLLIAQATAPLKTFSLDSGTIEKREGNAFTTGLRIAIPWPYALASDSMTAPGASRLELFEDAKLLGPPHSLHATIALKGLGSYSHWEKTLIFSTPDGSDPRINGRVYGGRVPLQILPEVWAWVLTAFLLSGSLLIGSRLRAPLEWLLARDRDSHGFRNYLHIAVALALCIWTMSDVIRIWAAGQSITFAIAGFLPVSDALGYYSCATSLGSIGDFSHATALPAFCARRVLYPSMLATVLSLSHWNPHVALLLQAAVAGISISALFTAAARSVGWLSSILASLMLFFYAQEHVLSRFVTEVGGFSAGLAGIALLLHYASGNKKLSLLVSGLGLISLAMTARAGALFILPALLFWSWLTLRQVKPQGWVVPSLAVLAAALIGPAIHFLILFALGIDSHNTGGNFSTILYGLSTGSRDWSQAYRDHAILFQNHSEAECFRTIYSFAISNIAAQPNVFLTSLMQAEQRFVSELFVLGGPISGMNSFLTVLFILGILRCLRGWRDSTCSLLLLIVFGELITAPLIIDSGGARVFAASIATRAILAGLGVQTTISTLLRLLRVQLISADRASPTTTTVFPRLPLLVGGFILSAVLAPITPAARTFRLSTLPSQGCPIGLNEVIVQLGNESQSFGVVARRDDTRIVPLRVAQETLAADRHLVEAWYGDGFRKLLPETLVIDAFQRRLEGFGTYRFILWHGPLPTDINGIYSICVDQATTNQQLGDFLFSEAKSMKRLDTVTEQ